MNVALLRVVIAKIKGRLGRAVLLFLSCCIVAGCAGTYRAYIDTLSYAFSPPQDASLSLQSVAASASDLLYVRNGERPQAVMALAFIDNEQQKWLSADQALLVLDHGRIARTAGFSHDLLFTSNLAADPLKLTLAQLTAARWQRLTDWQHGEYGYEIDSDFMVAGNEVLTVEQYSVNTVKVIERARLATTPNFLRFDQQWQNEYWFAEDSGLLLKSRQQPAPYTDTMELFFISRFAREVAVNASALQTVHGGVKPE